MGATGILDQREEYASHVRQNDAAFRDGGAPLYFDGIGAIDPLGGVFLAPTDQRDAGAAGIVNDPERLATSQPNRCVPAGRDLFAADDRLRRDRGAVKGGGFRQAFWRQVLSGRPKLLVTAPIGLGDFLLRLRRRHAVAPTLNGPSVIVKCASTGLPALPLIGRISCGQAENAITRSISARSRTYPPGTGRGGAAKPSVPSAD